MFFGIKQLTRRRAVFLVLALGVLLISVVLLLGAAQRKGLPGKEGIVRDASDCADYLKALGWETDPDSAECRDIVIPREFDGVFREYARLQQEQGFDLSAYRGEEVQLYSLRVTNYSVFTGPGEIRATVLVYNCRVIGGDIHSTALDGFMHGLT